MLSLFKNLQNTKITSLSVIFSILFDENLTKCYNLRIALCVFVLHGHFDLLIFSKTSCL